MGLEDGAICASMNSRDELKKRRNRVMFNLEKQQEIHVSLHLVNIFKQLRAENNKLL